MGRAAPLRRANGRAAARHRRIVPLAFCAASKLEREREQHAGVSSVIHIGGRGRIRGTFSEIDTFGRLVSFGRKPGSVPARSMVPKDVHPTALRALLDIPWPLFEYQRFLESEARRAPARNDLFADDQVRLEPRPEDILVASPGITVEAAGQSSVLEFASHRLRLEGLAKRDAERLLELMDGRRTAAEIGWSAPGLETFLRTTFGLLVFAPATVAALESMIPGWEVVRFPSSPYAIARPYWENMATVRRGAEERRDRLTGATCQAIEALRELHVLATLGESLENFYKPSSPVSDGGVRPGSFWETPTRRLELANCTLLLAGPRAKVDPIAGEQYHALVMESVGDADASQAPRTFRDADDLDWGQVVRGRAPRDPGIAEWYCLPRPLRPEHFERLFTELRHLHTWTRHGERSRACEHAARFHWHFIHLHPFRCANQCLAMNLINAALGSLLSSGLPHLILDHFALRLSLNAYVRLFDRAVEAYAFEAKSTAERYREYRERRQGAFTLMQSLARPKSASEARDWVRAHPEQARAALLVLPS